VSAHIKSRNDGVGGDGAVSSGAAQVANVRVTGLLTSNFRAPHTTIIHYNARRRQMYAQQLSLEQGHCWQMTRDEIIGSNNLSSLKHLSRKINLR
jgi:hypothetical protein